MSDVPDCLNWNMATDGVVTSKLTYSFLAGNVMKVPWHKLIWNTYTPPTRAFISWRFIHNKLPTDDNLRKKGCFVVSICCFCRSQTKTSHHIFLDCPITSQLWVWLGRGIGA